MGNARVSFADTDNDGEISSTDILQTNHYYPFGMKHEPNTIAGSTENAYQYNGKELNTDFGLDWLDYGARWYDASIARWSAIDPHAESYYQWTPYNYVYNNPLSFIDPDGKDAVVTIDKKEKKIDVKQTFHASIVNFKEQLKSVAKVDEDGELVEDENGKVSIATIESFVMYLQYQYNDTWGSETHEEIDGEFYELSFSMTINFHKDDETRDKAVTDDPTSNKLVIEKNLTNLKGKRVQGNWRPYSKERRLSLDPNAMMPRDVGHEVGHSLSIPGHKHGTGEITSYDPIRSISQREIQVALTRVVSLSKTVEQRFVVIHLKGYGTKKNQEKYPHEILESYEKK